MSKRILIDASNAEETRVAVIANGKLDDYEVERGKKNAVKGDVYLAKITRVEPSLQAAFVEFGASRNGFLPLTEIHPDYFKIPLADQDKLSDLLKKLQDDEIEYTGESDEEIQTESNEKKDLEINDENLNSNEESSNNKDEIRKKIIKKNPRKDYVNFFRKYKIQDVIKPRQVILVQVNKEERGFKGAALTTFLSFAGRYCVLMPNSLNNDGISRKIGDIEERKKLKTILASVNVPQNMSVIVRTAGIGKTKKEISKDLTYLTAQWNKIRANTIKSESPNLVYEEGSILTRTIRDMLTDEVDEVLIAGKNAFNNIKKLTKNIVPSYLKKIKLFKESDKSLFSENSVESQINELFSLTVKLESGGSIVINTTEALVAIDVNSGKNTSERNIENTAVKTNLEAAVEVARQLRLRDLGGLVVIDFIDMDDYRNNFKVEKTIKSALYQDRARVQVGRISMFGLLELSRQRLRSSIIDRSFEKCPYCNGSGVILNINSISDQILKVIKEKLTKKGLKLQVKCNSALAEILMNEKREEINHLEMQNDCKIMFNFDNHYSLHEPLIELNNAKVIHLKEQKVEKKVKKKVEKKAEKKIEKKVEKKVEKKAEKKLEKKVEKKTE
jgi:ribonuclease E